MFNSELPAGRAGRRRVRSADHLVMRMVKAGEITRVGRGR
jgi:hypothetical protein